MVYESDFYTVRRPYSRPTITSYSVTAPRISVTTWRVKPSIRTSVLIGELDRIHHRSRPHLSYVPTEDFLNSRPLVDFDDETKIIRAETERLMKRIYTSVPHPRTTTPLQIVPYYGHRANDKYNSHRHYNTVSEDIYNMSHYNEPSARTIGRGHLACVSFAGGRGYPRRKHLYLDENRDIQDEIKFRSYYNKNRAYEDAMSLPTGFASYLLRLQPDNRNGTLTSSEKLHITNILKERKGRNSADDNKKTVSAAMNGTPEKKTSSYKSQPANETVIPIERETKSYKSKSKDPKPFENHESEINGSVDTSNSQILEETQRKLSAPKPAPEVTPIVQPEERIIEVNIEPEVLEEKRKESLKSSRKPSKTKIQLQEKELKIEIEPRTKDDEKLKEVTGKEVVIGHEKTQEENPSTKESHGLETAEVVQQKIENGDHTGELIHESKPEIGTEAVKAETIIATELLEATDTPIVTESPIAIDTAIVPESPIATETATATESPITTEPPITTQSSIATEEIIDVVTVDSKCENIEENLTHNIQNESIEKTEDEIPEQDLNKTAVGSDESILQIVDDKKEDNISTIEKEASSDIEQRITETTQESVIQTRQVIVSSTIQETTEIVVKSNELETGNTEQEYVGEQVMPGLDDKTSPEDTSAGIVQTVTVGNQEESENLINTKNINSEDLLNRINSEASADSNTPRERIIEIEIERPDDLEHIIEEVTDLRIHEVQRESDTEPLVEEPQSPETELIYNTNTTNAVCEVLSDVAEEA